jgi:lambda family phage portal protein
MQKILGRFGYVPVQFARASVTSALRVFQRQRRNYDAGAQSRLTLDFPGTSVSADSDLVRQLRVMRARARALVKNEPYARRYSRLIEKNIAGSAGVQLSLLGREDDAGDYARSDLRLSRAEADQIQRQWNRWCASTWVSSDRRLTWPQVQRLALRNGCMDGEIFCRLVIDPRNPWLLSLDWLVPEQLDEQLNSSLNGGGEIRLAVEFDPMGRRSAYHAYRRNPDDFLIGSQRIGRGDRERIPAGEMVHWYLPDFIGQTRGVPWLYSAIARVNMLGGYEEAELVAARVAASKMGFIIPPQGQEYAGDGEDAEGNTIVEAQPGTFESLPAGSDLKSFDPQHPNANFPAFHKCMLRGVAAGGDVSYHTLTGDLESVNYSSARIGLLDERDGYAVLQDEFIHGFCLPIFRAWLVAQSINGTIPLTVEESAAFDEILWRPRRWAWVDPQKEIGGMKDAVALGIRSRTQIVAEQGGEIAQTFKELGAEQIALEALGLLPAPEAPPSSAPAGDDEEGDDDEAPAGGSPARNGAPNRYVFPRG